MFLSSIKVLICLIFFIFSGCFSPVEELGEKTDRTIVKRSPNTLRLIASYSRQNGIPNGRLENIFLGPQGQVYLRTQNITDRAADNHSDLSLFRRDAHGAMVTSTQVPMANFFGAQSIVAPDGRILVTTTQGLTIVTNQHNNLIVSPQRLSSGEEITATSFDSQGRLYVARTGEGIDIYDGGLPADPQNARPSRVEQAGTIITHLTAGVNGRVYATRSNQTFFYIDGGNQVTPRGNLPFTAEREVTDMVFDHANSRLIVGSTDGVYVLDEDGGMIEQYSRAESGQQRLENNNVLAVEVSSNGRVILAGFGDPDGAIRPNEAGLVVIVDGSVRERYTPQQLGFSDPAASIYAIRRIDGGRFYIGSSNGELALVELNIELRAEGQAHNNNPRRDQHAHRIVARKGIDNHSSILPHPPRIEVPGAPCSESWGHWFKRMAAAMRDAFVHAHSIGKRSADEQNDQDSYLAWWKSYHEQYYDVWIKQKDGKEPPQGIAYVDGPGRSFVYGSIHEELDTFKSTEKLANKTRIVVEAMSLAGLKKDITLEATLSDGNTDYAIQDLNHLRYSSIITTKAAQRLRVQVVNPPKDDFYFSLLQICLTDSQDDNFGYDVTILVVAGNVNYLPAKIDGQKIAPSQFAGYNTEVWPEFSYTSKGESQGYWAQSILYAGQYYIYGLIFDFGPDYLRGNLWYKIRNVVDGKTRWSQAFDVDGWRFGGSGQARFANTSSLPKVELACDEQVIGMTTRASEGYFALGPSGAINSSRGNYINLRWGDTN